MVIVIICLPYIIKTMIFVYQRVYWKFKKELQIFTELQIIANGRERKKLTISHGTKSSRSNFSTRERTSATVFPPIDK